MDRSDIGCFGGCFMVSGNSRITNTIAHRPSAAMPRKLARQPNVDCRMPPSEGATTGASAVIEPMRASSRPARTP